MSAYSVTSPRGLSLAALNGRYHRAAVNAFMIVVLAHWAEHLVRRTRSGRSAGHARRHVVCSASFPGW